jgi:phosphoserine aminotransferase
VYCHLTSNNTIEGVQFHDFPDAGAVPLAADMTSDFLSRPFDPAPFGLIYSAAQKNVGTAGLSIVIIREDLLARARTDLPEALQHRAHEAAGSLYSTPPVFAVYLAALTVRWLKGRGGLAAIARENQAKAALLYAVIDGAGGFYRCDVEPASRSTMNVVFRLPGPELDAAFVAETEAAGLLGVKGHRSRGGIRVSLYNAVALASARAAADFMRDFARRRG